MAKNNFNEYGFKSELSGEILKEVHNQFIGYILEGDNPKPLKWNKQGRTLVGGHSSCKYDLVAN